MSELAHRTIKNSTFNIMAFVWLMLLTFIVTPVVIGKLGATNYGIYILINSVLGFVGLIDLGLGYLFVKRLSENSDEGGLQSVGRIFSSTIIANFFIGLIIFAVMVLGANFIRVTFKIPLPFSISYLVLFGIIGLTTIIGKVSGTISQVSFALQRIDIGAKVNIANMTFLQVGSLVVASLGWGIYGLYLVQLLVSLIFLFVNIGVWRRLLPQLKFKFEFSAEIFSQLFKSGILVTLSNAMVNILNQLDKMVLSAFFGPSATTYYSSGQMVTEKISSVANNLSGTFFPIFSHIEHNESREKLKNVFRRSLGFIILVTSGLLAVVFVYGKKLLQFWLGVEFSYNIGTSFYLLALTYGLMSIFVFINNFLSGTKKIKLLAGLTTSMAVLDVVFMFLLIPEYEILGAAIAYLISMAPVIVVLIYIEKKFFDVGFLRASFFYGKKVCEVFLVGVIVFFVSRCFLYTYINELYSVIIAGGFSFVLFIILYRLFGFFKDEDWNLFVLFFSKLLRNKIKIWKK